jgi:hypothetical protein
MVQVVSRRPLTAEAQVRSRISPCGICGGQSGTATGFFPEYFGFPLSVSFHRCSITWKNKKKLIIFIFIFITRLHNKPQGRGTSVASAAGPSTTKKNPYVTFKSSGNSIFNSEWGRMWNRPWPIFRYPSRICLETLRKIKTLPTVCLWDEIGTHDLVHIRSRNTITLLLRL